MIKKILASALALHLMCPAGLFAQNTQNSAEDIELLLTKPEAVYKPLSAATGASAATVSAMAAIIGGTEKRIAYLKNRPLDALVDNVLEIMHIMQRDEALRRLNPSLEREVSAAFMALRSKYDMNYFREPLKYQEVPSIIRNRFVFVLEEVKLSSRSSYSTRFKEIAKEIDFILGRKQAQTVPAAKGGTAGLIVLGLVTLGSAAIMFMSGDNDNPGIISSDRAQFTRSLKAAKEKSPTIFALTALQLAGKNRKLTADIIANDKDLAVTLKDQVAQMTSAGTVNALNSLFNTAGAKAADNKADLIKALRSKDAKEFKISYSL